MSPLTGLRIYDRACSWCGVAFRHQGRNRHGCDCAGLVLGVLAELGHWRELPVYGPGGQGVDALALIAASGAVRRDPRDAQPGDLLAWPTDTGQPHIGLAGAGEVIHASQRHGRVLRQPLRPALAARLLGAWDLTALETTPRV